MAVKKNITKLQPAKALQKTPTGISGFDEITFGGLPAGRTSLICGEAGCGKTLFGMEFLVHGAMQFNEPGVFVAFEEKANELATNVVSLGFDVNKLITQNKLRIDYVHIDKSEIEETGEYDLEGLFIRLDHAIDSIGAKRVVLDTIENLFAGLDNRAILRAELRRLFQWLKEKNVTALITGEKGEGSLTREGLEEYVSDCVIVLDHRVNNQISTRRLRIIKYRGSVHGTNEYPFLIDSDGISVLPVTSLRLQGKVLAGRIGTGIPTLDSMFGEKGIYRGSSMLVTGTAGTGKTSIAASFANATCNRNERCLYFAFEESAQQIMRNMLSIGLQLNRHVKKGLLKFYAARPTMYGLEMHLVQITKEIRAFKPHTVIIDPITNLVTVGTVTEVQSILNRLLDFLQVNSITAVFTGLTPNSNASDHNDESVASLVDTWLHVKDIEMNGERNRGLYIMKSRGIKHSNQVREFLITSNGLVLQDVYLGPDGVLTGSAREAHKLQLEANRQLQLQITAKNQKELKVKEKELELKIQTLKTEFDSFKDNLSANYIEDNRRIQIADSRQKNLLKFRTGIAGGNSKAKK
jgi:circadian clock protein KaiC